MKEFIIERRLLLGGTSYGERLVEAFVKHPEMVEVVETSVETEGEEGGWAVNMRIVYRAERCIEWGELVSLAQDVPLYEPVDPEVLRELEETVARMGGDDTN